MKSVTFTVRIFGIFILFFVVSSFALTDPSQIYFSFNIRYNGEIESITRLISIDKVEKGTVYAYANKKQFDEFVRRGYNYQILKSPGEQYSVKETQETWSITNTYPTYSGFISTMNGFQSSFPTLCKVEEIGRSVNNRQLLAAKITSNVTSSAIKPGVLLTGTIHGDETVGLFVLTKLIDYLLVNYSSSSRIKKLLDSLDIYIFPLANPDGTYRSGDVISNPWRSNANGVDLNRNMPEPVTGTTGDGNEIQKENLAYLQFLESHRIVLSADIHGGIEAFVGPWFGIEAMQADWDWYETIGRTYASTVQNVSPAGYFTGGNNGIIWAASYYIAYGTKADYVNYWHRAREAAIELSDVKFLPESELLNHWNYNREALLGYIESALNGFRGKVTDAQTGLPIPVSIELSGHDQIRSGIYSSSNGIYTRFAPQGTYTITVRSPGYTSQTFINRRLGTQPVFLNAQLQKNSNNSRLYFQLNNSSKMVVNAINGNNYIYGVEESSTHYGFSFRTTQPEASLDTYGNLNRNSLIENSGSFLNAASNLTGGIVLRDPSGTAQMHINQSGTIRIRGTIQQGFYDESML